MAFGNVLAVVTGDRSDEMVVAQAADLVRPIKGQLHALYVIRIDRALPVDAEVPPAVARAEDVLQGVEEQVRLPRGDVEAGLLQARALGPAVVQEASNRSVDAIVMGTSYPTEHGAFSLGEDINYVLEHAPCLVVLWREPASRRKSRNGRTAAGRNGTISASEQRAARR